MSGEQVPDAPAVDVGPDTHTSDRDLALSDRLRDDRVCADIPEDTLGYLQRSIAYQFSTPREAEKPPQGGGTVDLGGGP